ncbi:MAG TPA: universal stress protein [Spirochaetota bacterium]|nr:universal stress protein [Spirochaetota bacterium]
MLKFTNILYPLNLESNEMDNVSEVLEFTRGFQAAVHFLFVNDEAAGYRHPTDFQDSVALKIKQAVPSELLSQSKIIYAVSKGDIGDEVKKYCKDNSIDLIITSHKHRGKLYSSLFDSPDEDIIDTVNIPVLILPKTR